MILGTASHVGKSVLAAALCRILRDDGFDVAPFKAQNMALNSAVTPEGLEIGRAQALQAEAARIAPTVDMNPILLKPCGEARSQLVVLGRPAGDVGAREYHARRVSKLFGSVCESYSRLAARHDAIVLEGAGSPAEVNLARTDIANMRMAREAKAACVLVADVDRGGIFAALVGTMGLLPAADRRRVRGFVVNRFRGDPAVFAPGVAYLQKRLRRPCLGVVPHLPDLGLDEEDSVALPASVGWPREEGRGRRVRVAVVALPRIANFTDFDALRAEPSLTVAFVRTADALAGADVVVLPGSKQTIDDLRWLERRGIAAGVRAHARAGGFVVGLCGGFQMLGRTVSDPFGVEGGGSRRGLGLLDVRTTLRREKVTLRAHATVAPHALFGRPTTAARVVGYEIHMGDTDYGTAARPLFRVRREGAAAATRDGAVGPNGRVIGTYLHGLFDDDRFRHAVIRAWRAGLGLAAPGALAPHSAGREARLDRWAAHVRRSLDVRTIEGWLR